VAERRSFRYRLTSRDGFADELMVVIDGSTLTCVEPEPVANAWTALSCHQCENCPLDPATTPLCPYAARIAPVLSSLANLFSHDAVDVEAECGNRRVTSSTTAQAAASSLIGLLGAASGCPHTAFLRPMAWFHQPLATVEETVFRAVTTWLLGRYFAAEQGEATDWRLTDLKQRYEQLHEVNLGLAERMRLASEKDAGVNAVVRLDTFAKTVPYSIDDMLAELRPLFSHLDS
jgi:Domain of unknown function (DUF6901)